MITLQNVMSIEVIREAYYIAWDYLHRTGAIKDEQQARSELLAGMVDTYNRGMRNKLVMANKAITTFHRP